MKSFREILRLLRNAVLVTVAVVLGFVVGGALGIPSWLQVICLLPAGYLFIRLSGEEIRSTANWLPYCIATLIFVGLIVLVIAFLEEQFPELSDGWIMLVFALLVAVSPVNGFANWLQRLRKGKQDVDPSA